MPPAAVTAAATSSTVPGRCEVVCAVVERALTQTVQPAVPNATAIPRPTPRLAPVTHATRSSMGSRVTVTYDNFWRTAGSGLRPWGAHRAGPSQPRHLSNVAGG